MINMTNYTNNQFEPKLVESGLFTLSAGQTTGLAANDQVAFDTAESNNGLIFDSGNNQWTLKANKRYKLSAELALTFSAAGGYIGYQFYDVTNSDYLSDARGEKVPPTSTSNVFYSSTTVAEVTPTTDIVVELRIYEVGSLSNILADFTYLSIQEIQSFQPPATYPYEMNAQAYTEDRVSGTNWTTTRCSLRPYKTLDGAWFLKGNIRGSLSSGATSITLTIAGVTFNTAAGTSNVPVSTNSTGSYGYSNAGTSALVATAASSQTQWRLSFDVELDSKPTWL